MQHRSLKSKDIACITHKKSFRKKEVELRGRKILIINDGGKYMAINGLCSHYNWPLVTGVLSTTTHLAVSVHLWKRSESHLLRIEG